MMKCEKARQVAERPRRPCWMVRARQGKVLLRTEKLLEKAGVKKIMKSIRLEKS